MLNNNSIDKSMDMDVKDRTLILLALLVAGTFFMENLDSTIITPAIPMIAHDFAVGPGDLNLAVSIYMLTLGIFIPISGWVADRLGSRSVFTFAIALFTISSLLCGTSQTVWQLIAFRVIQGIGGAMMVPVGRLVVLRLTPKKSLVSVMATLTWPGLVAPVLGPPLGGYLTDYSGWRWIFYLNVPLGLIACVVAIRLVPSVMLSKEYPFDWLGFILTSTGLVFFLSASELFGQAPVDWGVVGSLLIGGFCLSTLAILHLQRTSSPMLDLAVLRIPTFAVTIWSGSLFRMGVSAVPFLLPLMLQIGMHYSAWQAGSMLMIVFVGNIAMKPMTTPILRRFGFKPVMLFNGIINSITIALYSIIGSNLGSFMVYPILLLSGMTRSLQFTAFNTIAFADISKKDMSNASTLFSTAFQLALGLGVALGAIAWRVGGFVVTDGGSLASFHVAFSIIALCSLLGAIGIMRLPKNVGNTIM